MNPTFSHKLERLDVPGKGGSWKLKQSFAGADKRRDEFRRTIANHNHDHPDTIPKLRTLIDLGLWDDMLLDGTDPGEATRPKPGSAQRIAHMVSSVFGNASLDSILRLPRNEARVMLSSLDLAKAKPVPVAVLHLAIEAGLDPSSTIDGPNDDSILVSLARKGDREQALLVFKAGANAHAQRWPHNTVGHVLVSKGGKDDIELLRRMMAEGLDINDAGETRGASQDTRLADLAIPPIGMAIINDNLMLIQTLIDMGATLDWKGHSAFHVVASGKKDRPKRQIRRVMDALLEWGAKFDEADRLGHTPLWNSIPDRPEKARWLVEHGAKLDIRAVADSRSAIERRSPPSSLLERLVETNADMEAWSPILLAIEKQHPDCWTWSNSREGEGFKTVLDLAIDRGGPWGAVASSRQLAKEVGVVEEQSNTATVGRAPRF